MTTLAAAAAAVGLDLGFTWQNNERDGSIAYYYGISTEHLLAHNAVVTGEASMLFHGDLTWGVASGNVLPSTPTSTAGWDWSASDALDAWAAGYGMKRCSSNIVSNTGVGWLSTGMSASDMRSYLETWVTTAVARYPRIRYWCLLNEAIAAWEGNANGYRSSPMLTVLGESYVKYAFDAAVAASQPGQQFIWNDNHAIEDNYSSGTGAVAGQSAFQCLYAQLVRWLNDGVRIDGVGAQFHLSETVNASASVMVDRMNQIADLGLDIYITELDITDTSYTGTAASIKQQCADFTYDRLSTICRDVSRLKFVNLWGTSDAVSWLNSYLGPRGDGIPRTGNCYDRSDPPLPNPMRQALIDAMLLRAPVFDVTGNVANTLTNDRATITVATPSTAIEVRFGTDVLVDHNGLALTSPGRLTDETSATLDDQSSLALLDNEVNSLTGQTTTGSESVTLTLTGGT
jgi:endo-1,4-beta-xylanase